MVSGSQPEPCTGEAGDHLMLRLLKNKLDYCRLHGIHLLYNRDFLHPATAGNWAKLPILRAAMLAPPGRRVALVGRLRRRPHRHDFSLPLATKYAAYNLVAYGWPEKIKEEIMAGIKQRRAAPPELPVVARPRRRVGPHGPRLPGGARALGKLAMETLSDKKDPWFDDQTGLVYLLLTKLDRLGTRSTSRRSTTCRATGWAWWTSSTPSRRGTRPSPAVGTAGGAARSSRTSWGASHATASRIPCTRRTAATKGSAARWRSPTTRCFVCMGSGMLRCSTTPCCRCRSTTPPPPRPSSATVDRPTVRYQICMGAVACIFLLQSGGPPGLVLSFPYLLRSKCQVVTLCISLHVLRVSNIS
ncbi:hypothetical protein HU200_038274 [Digitaria exilis]|uniref:Uncharacterized protein n=1 Tax=Digitaria exilis TaxID=1010633 RepID=A0A835EII4_9POAL|nr:hypothetical protein HU200_038274 [Digitaria exilis]